MRLFLVLGVALFVPLIAGAQALGGLGTVSGEAFTASVRPEYPAPFSQATVSLLSDTLDLTQATLTVLVDGKETYRGAAHSFSVPLGRTGRVTTVKMTIAAGGKNYSKTASIQPQDVVLIAEPIASAPPLYPGKPLVPLEGKVRVVAVASLKDAQGKLVAPSAYAYAWTVDGVRLPNSSGVGKSAIIIDSPFQYRSRDVSVVVVGGALVGGAALSLSASAPSVRIYESDSLLGVRFERALSGAYTINKAETTLYAAPFSLSISSGLPFLRWFLNGADAQTGPVITLRPTGSGRGAASLSLTASGGDSEAATALAELSLNFGESSGLNLFGL